MKLTIEKIIPTGKSLGRIKGKVVLTNEGLPGEIVEIKVTKEKKGYIDAKTTTVLQSSPQRIKPRCTHYKVCSPYQYIDYPLQTKIKESQINELFSRQLKFEKHIPFKASPQTWHYRNRLHLHIIYKQDTPQLAYHEAKSHLKFIPIDECFLASHEINSTMKGLLKLIEQNKLKFIREVSVRENIQKDQLLLTLYIDSVKNINNLKPVEELTLTHKIKGIISIDEKKSKHLVFGQEYIEKTINDITFYVGPESFFQINTPMLEILINDLKNHATENYRTVADLYCGVGTFGLILAKQTAKTIGIETNKETIRLLHKNITLNGIKNFKAYQGKCKKFKSLLTQNAVDLLIVDPPRKGLETELREAIIKRDIPKIIYISCDPATLTRDLKTFLEKYRIEQVYAYDFFPQTPHIETMTILTRT